MLLNKRQLEKLKEEWWKNDDFQKTCVKPEDQSDGISIQNIGGVFIVIFVGIAMACVTLVFEYWYYKYRKHPKIIDVAEVSAKQERTGKLGMDTGHMQPPDEKPEKPTKGSYFNSNLLRARPFNFKPKFQI